MNVVARELKKSFEKNEAMCQRVLGLFHLFSNKGRFRIVCLLAHGEFCVNDITEVVSKGKLSNISQQLRILTLAGIIERRREDQHILYSLKDERVRKVIEFLQSQFLIGEPK